MDHKELFICLSVVTTASLFSSVAETSRCRAQTPSHLYDSRESAVKGKYKSPFYKLWQYVTKNKPHRYNDGIVHYNYKKLLHIHQCFASFKCFLKKKLQLKNRIKQTTSIKSQRLALLKSSIFLHETNNPDQRNESYFIPHIDLVGWIFTNMGNLLKKEATNNHQKYPNLSSYVLQVYQIKRQREKTPHGIDIFINKALRNKVYC
ncbi:hypothetical protein GGR08_000054 [Bartonella fuyuanensis]|uniref:Uncharacterized protein n=1 Tax=Bartonella fuyuanensis TaxID=1460968 RepID=A0A840DVS2_9HYPH|nr:hypothetical protein [Bartonella fuyuanensis]